MNTPASSEGAAITSPWNLTAGETYRIAYGVGGTADRRITRSVVVFTGAGERRRWDGAEVRCLEFALPRGRVLTLLEDQLVDARPALINERGQLVLINGGGRQRRRIIRRRLPR
jgi:hypothetical protein